MKDPDPKKTDIQQSQRISPTVLTFSNGEKINIWPVRSKDPSTIHMPPKPLEQHSPFIRPQKIPLGDRTCSPADGPGPCEVMSLQPPEED